MDKKTLTEAELVAIIERAEALGNLPDFTTTRDASLSVARENACENETATDNIIVAWRKTPHECSPLWVEVVSRVQLI